MSEIQNAQGTSNVEGSENSTTETISSTSSSSSREIPNGTMVGNYEIIEIIGEGGYGHIYSVLDLEKMTKFAMKVEYFDSDNHGLVLETKILKNIQKSNLFPVYYDSGKTSEFRYLVMELMGPSLSLLRRTLPEKKLGKYTLLTLAGHMVRCIQKLHKFGYVHRDIKPGNFLIRPIKDSPIVLIDFGLSRRYIDKKTGKHKPPREDPGYTGTVRYASLNAHDELELSRRDDLISWFYSMIELANSKTPWPGSDDKKLTISMKREMSPEEICEGLPSEFLQIYKHIMSLKYEDEPDYNLIYTLLKKGIKREKFDKKVYDWQTLSKEELKDISSIPLDMDTSKVSIESTTYSKSEVDSNENGYCCLIC